MAELKVGAKFVLTNPLIGSTNALGSTPANDSVIVGPRQSDGSQTWYLVETTTSGYFGLHTNQKGDFAALDVLNYNGRNSLDLHMYAVQDNTGQKWRLNKQDDGSVKINNLFTGSDIYLDVVRDTLQPTLAAKDGPGQRWTLSQLGTSSTATSSSTRSATNSSSYVTPTSATATDMNTSSATATSNASPSSGLSGGVIGGIVGGSVGVAAIVVGAILLWRRSKRRHDAGIPSPPTISGRPMLHVSQTSLA